MKNMNDKAQLIAAMEHILRAQTDAHRKLLVCLDRKREAVRTARIDAVGAICDEERQIMLSVSEMEAQRIELARRIVDGPKGPAGMATGTSPVPLSAILNVAQGESRVKLEAIATELREVATEVRNRSSTVRAAAESLARHMSGVMQTVHSALSRAGVYGRQGAPAMGAQLQYSVDLRS
ncbi:MAG TPA: flagellar export chaperone FlgN [Phycisphaerales bacterium]|nr:flagellar export chaperone FlgN [Phycisphaerales bacterium]